MRTPLLFALVAALAATLWVGSHDGGDTVEAVKSSGASASPARQGQSGNAQSPARSRTSAVTPSLAPSNVALGLPQVVSAWRQREPLALKDISQLKAWGPSLPPPPVVQAKVESVKSQSPQAPRFPHAWVGRFNDMAVVSGPQSTWVLAEGQVIEGQWRVDQIRDRQMQLTYLPFQQVQTVAMQTP